MKFHSLFLSAACLATGVLAQQEAAPPLGDSAIRRVEDCVCYASVEEQNLKGTSKNHRFHPVPGGVCWQFSSLPIF